LRSGLPHCSAPALPRPVPWSSFLSRAEQLPKRPRVILRGVGRSADLRNWMGLGARRDRRWHRHLRRSCEPMIRSGSRATTRSTVTTRCRGNKPRDFYHGAYRPCCRGGRDRYGVATDRSGQAAFSAKPFVFFDPPSTKSEVTAFASKGTLVDSLYRSSYDSSLERAGFEPSVPRRHSG
jgi:hypothetical protein